MKYSTICAWLGSLYFTHSYCLTSVKNGAGVVEVDANLEDTQKMGVYRVAPQLKTKDKQ